jgi:tellurite resistance protein
MEPAPSLLRARAILNRNTSHHLPDVAGLASVAVGGVKDDPLFSALLEAAFLVASADGQLALEEIGELADLIAQMTGERVSPGELAASITSYSAELERAGRGSRIEALAASCTEPQARRQVIGFAALVALCDRDLAPSELFVLHSLGRALGVTMGEVNTIVRSLRGELGMEG